MSTKSVVKKVEKYLGQEKEPALIQLAAALELNQQLLEKNEQLEHRVEFLRDTVNSYEGLIKPINKAGVDIEDKIPYPKRPFRMQEVNDYHAFATFDPSKPEDKPKFTPLNKIARELEKHMLSEMAARYKISAIHPAMAGKTSTYFEQRTSGVLEKLNDTFGAIKNLSEQLKPVLRPVPGTPTTPQTEPAGDSQLNEFLNIVDEKLEALQVLIGDIAGRLTV
jgi:hypothetical protein